MKRYRLTVLLQGAPDQHFYGTEKKTMLSVAKTQLLDTSRWKTLNCVPLEAVLYEKEMFNDPDWKPVQHIAPKDAVKL